MKMRVIAVALSLVLVGCGDSNSKLEYGESGLPKNCRALIKANIDGWQSGEYTPVEALGSIDRNCGEWGSSWGQ